MHDFRHRFAIRTLLGWHREGIDIEKKLSSLSTYRVAALLLASQPYGDWH
ncbi:hypothetical protein [Polaromonas sp.]|nr:hypothetical protein [Burkholderiales bacterium]